jgi:hypothetical protein
MRQRIARPEVDREDPAVAMFLAECEGLAHPVSLRLVGLSESDVQLAIDRLQRALGAAFRPTQPRQSGRGEEWIAYGTITE